MTAAMMQSAPPAACRKCGHEVTTGAIRWRDGAPSRYQYSCPCGNDWTANVEPGPDGAVHNTESIELSTADIPAPNVKQEAPMPQFTIVDRAEAPPAVEPPKPGPKAIKCPYCKVAVTETAEGYTCICKRRWGKDLQPINDGEAATDPAPVVKAAVDYSSSIPASEDLCPEGHLMQRRRDGVLFCRSCVNKANGRTGGRRKKPQAAPQQLHQPAPEHPPAIATLPEPRQSDAPGWLTELDALIAKLQQDLAAATLTRTLLVERSQRTA